MRWITPDEQIVFMPATLRRHWTEAEVRQLIDETLGSTPRYELVDGELLVTPAPGDLHQRVVFELAKRIDAFVSPNRLGETRIGPSDVRLAEELVLQPDVYVVPSVQGKRPRADVRATRLMLAIEVVSPGSARYDRVIKRRAYQAAGVPEYWIVDADAWTIERWRPHDTRPEVLDTLLSWTPSETHEQFVLDVAQFFAETSDDG